MSAMEEHREPVYRPGDRPAVAWMPVSEMEEHSEPVYRPGDRPAVAWMV